MSTHPRHQHVSLVDGLQVLVRFYPWSVLWVLFAIGLAQLLDGTWITNGLILLLILAVCGHGLRRPHVVPRRGPSR